ncbi:unnamed protein product, partial [Ascophyllum nodosum]
IETTVRTRRLLWAGAILRGSNDRLPKRVVAHELDGTAKRGRGARDNDWFGCVKEHSRVFGIQGYWEVEVRDEGRWYNSVR